MFVHSLSFAKFDETIPNNVSCVLLSSVRAELM